MDKAVSPGILSASVRGPELDRWPIPDDQVVSGSPQASGRFLWQSDDKRLSNGLWRCTEGSFTWDYTWDETIFFIEGEVTITAEGQGSRTYRDGDMIFVPSGTRSRWDVGKTVRKAFHICSDDPVEL